MTSAAHPVLQLGEAGRRRLGALRAQRTLTWVGLGLAPSLTAGLICLSHSTVGVSIALAVSMMACATTFERQRFPLHLMRLAGYVARLAIPLAGVLVVLLASLAFEPIPLADMFVPLLGAWIVLLSVLYVVHVISRDMELRMAVVGDASVATALRRELETARLGNQRVVGWIDFSAYSAEGADESATSAADCLGTVAQTREIVTSERIDVVVFALRESGSEAAGISSIAVLEDVARSLLGTDVRMIGANQVYEELFGHVPLATMNAAWFQYVLHPRFQPGSTKQKRLFDILVAGAMLIGFSPVILAAAIAIKLTDRGPVFYRQYRVGERGQEFAMMKLRSMRVDAESDGVAQWASAEDDRITPVGRFLRRSHFDELPQLLNVIRGDMSLVGPRPERRTFVDALERQLPYYDRRHLMRPGLTGWAQVRIGYAGTDRGTAWKLSHDLYYFKHRSVGLDMLIMLETLVTPIQDLRAQTQVPDETFVAESFRERVS